MMLQQAEGHPAQLEEITLAQGQQEAALIPHVILLQLEEALTLQETAAQLTEVTHLDGARAQQREEAVIHQILGTITLRQEDPLHLAEIVAVILEVHHQEDLALEVLALEVPDRAKVHLHLKKEEIRKHYS